MHPIAARVRRLISLFIKYTFITRENDFQHTVQHLYSKPGTPRHTAKTKVDVTYYFQYARIFLIPGTRPRASILAMAYLRTIGLCFITGGVLWDFFVWGTYLEVREDHVAWISKPTNWLLILSILYLGMCIYASWCAPQYGISSFDAQPAPAIYIWIWNLFNVLMPLSVSALVANFTVLHTHDAAYVFAMISAFVTFVLVELYFGAHIATIHLLTAPLLALMVFFAYTAGAVLIFDEVMHAPLNWRDAPVEAGVCSLRLIVLTEFIGAIVYVINSARISYMGTRVYCPDPLVILNLKRGIFPLPPPVPIDEDV